MHLALIAVYYVIGAAGVNTCRICTADCDLIVSGNSTQPSFPSHSRFIIRKFTENLQQVQKSKNFLF